MSDHQNKNQECASEPNEGQTVQLLQRIRSQQIDPSTIRPEDRRLLVAHLISEGYSTAEMAQLLKVSDRTIERDRKAIRTENALPQDPALTDEMVGSLVNEAEISIQRIRRAIRGPDVSAATRIEAEHRCYQIRSDLVVQLRGTGHVHTATQRVEADLIHHDLPLFGPGELAVQLAQMRQVIEASGEKVPDDLLALEGEVAHLQAASKVQTLAADLTQSKEQPNADDA